MIRRAIVLFPAPAFPSRTSFMMKANEKEISHGWGSWQAY